MWNILAKLFGGGVSAVVDGATGIVKTIWGDRAAKDAAIAGEQHDVLAQFAAEFVARQQRSWWDSFVDGLNRLPRPGLVIGVHATFVWAAWDPVNFTICMQALQVVPDALWVVWLTIVAFYFGGRIIEQAPKTWKIEPRVLDLAREIAAERTTLRREDRADRQELRQDAAERRAEQAPDLTQNISENIPKPAPDYAELMQGLDASVPAEAWAEPDTLHPPVDNARDPARAVAATIWGEARGEPRLGKIAVACVIRNRVLNPGWWGRDWISVCTAKAQFSCWWDQQAQRVRTVDDSDERFAECLLIARKMMADNYEDPTGEADHYYADTIAPPKWAVGKTPTAVIGHHRFYKLGLDGRG